MAELRYNPISGDWIMVASHRQSRPQMPKNWCPFCPGSGRVPDEGFSVLRYPNDFPALSQTPPDPDPVATDVFQTKPAYGRCEVLLYSDQHNAMLCDLSNEHVHQLAGMWRECFEDFSADEKIQYVYIFENRGEPVGVTMPHPHGQVYGYSFVPQKVALEAEYARKHLRSTGRNLFLELLEEEKRVGDRILFENEHFTVYVPFFSPMTYGIHITANRHTPHIGAMSAAQLDALGETVRDCAGLYDALFDLPFPYMMCMHQAPVNMGEEQGELLEAFQFHIEYFPPLRSAQTQQFLASSETGAGAWCNPNCPEEKAKELRSAYQNYLRSRLNH